ncbi:polysaccharide pyruvyl transferase family protein [cf. Phormidesmis sp. LEGE 11477]|uniref:polysaccharide pyruvyl transferase family protein n=1 Tax=cf. Phormidesmis sp. LEGE 11477 TaxID=1828680 RepID=UPI001880E0C2|nr:polysaccharide pyruvyl transferase family protein [cf. Phormidesmis sp. LEGE 11477]MBE9059597.1 polysaccharide pyruvyl transferase family protein [cf. Phormidesmis sp. LEGE 11477]
MKISNMRGVTICGFYGNFNLGDEAMLAGMLKLFVSCREDLEFTVVSRNPVDTERRFHVSAIYPKSKRFWLSLLKNKYFVLGGGDLLRDSVKKPIARTWLDPLQKAQMLKCRTMVLGVSVGEVWRPETKRLIRKALNNVDLIAVRDNSSKLKLKEIGVDSRIHVMSDLALSDITTPPTRRVYDGSRSMHIGISVRHLQGRGLSTDLVKEESVYREIAQIIDLIVDTYDAEIHFLPFRTYKESFHPVDDDYVCALEAIRYSKYANHCKVHRYFDSLEDLKSTIASLDLVIGMRLHSLILASGLGVPIIAAEYDSKVKGFMDELEQGHSSIPLSEFNSDKVWPIVNKTLSDLPASCDKLHIGLAKYKERMSEFTPILKNMFS